MNLANVANGAMTRFIGERSERSEPQIWAGSLVNLANLANQWTLSNPGHEWTGNENKIRNEINETFDDAYPIDILLQ